MLIKQAHHCSARSFIHGDVDGWNVINSYRGLAEGKQPTASLRFYARNLNTVPMNQGDFVTNIVSSSRFLLEYSQINHCISHRSYPCSFLYNLHAGRLTAFIRHQKSR